jgi:hypothetical protein
LDTVRECKLLTGHLNADCELFALECIIKV